MVSWKRISSRVVIKEVLLCKLIFHGERFWCQREMSFSLQLRTLIKTSPETLEAVSSQDSGRNASGLDLPPSPPSLPIIGHLHLILSGLVHKSLQKISSKYGSLLHLRVFTVPIVLVSSASVTYEFFRAQDVYVSSRDLPANEGSILFGNFGFVTAPYGDYWKFMKKLMVTKLFGAQALEQSRGVRADELERFYATLLVKAMKNETVEIVEEAMKLVNNSISRMVMGRSCSEEKGEAETVRDLVTKADTLTKKVFLAAILRKPLDKFGISLFKTELMNVSSRFGEFLERILQEHEEKLDEHQDMDMMDVLLAAYRDKDAEYKITRNHIKSFFVDLFIAGTDTTTHTIEWTMAELINNPISLERLREEIESVVGNTRLIQETDLPKLPYLQAVVKEALRLHPPAPLVVRTSREGCNIGGYHVPEKTTLVVNTYAVMRDPDSWENPDEFQPERFLNSSGSERDEIKEQTLKYIPFGGGRRGCPGANLGYVLVETAIGVMIQCFDWRIKGEKVKMEEASGAMTMTMAHSLNCTLIARTQPLVSIPI